MNDGLAAQMAQQEVGPSSTAITLEEVVEALLNGADPEELLKQGVPIELLKQAAEMILAQAQSQEGTPTQAPVMQNPMTPGGQSAVSSEGLAHRLTQ